ncbi:MAG: family 20 glycosylhydrolase [Chitinispirillales bacterium]|jgi:hypothetical protein|nr:family 20 glycosylhydrolase [Chitinispirillales bacterium]
MEKQNFHLIPRVKNLRVQDGFWECAGGTIDTVIDAGININIPNAAGSRTGASDERYSIKISADGVRLVGASPRGLFRAETTFAQLLMNHPQKIPCLEIFDEPDFSVRGFYHDVTRGKVPTLDTLKSLADTLAFYKINQLQLYIEHTFAFSKIPELWEDKTPLTAADITELDRYCAERYIDLVPSLSTFGHLYELLRLPRFEHLNELEISASQTTRCLWDRMAHYTLDVGNPESFELVKGMIEEYAPLFSSPYFNICCDETFDLGKGKNAARAEKEGVGRLYVDFVGKIMNTVISMGKTPMLWGDIILKHPELISELPPGAIFLNWDYVPDVTDASVKTFKAAGVTQYVCPGVQGWSRFAADLNRACLNISKMAAYGKAAGALGLLNTDWGDCGHVNLLSTSYHGLAFGAALSWDVGDGGVCIDKNDGCIDNAAVDDFDSRFSFLQWGIDGSRLGNILRELGELSGYHFGNLYAWVTDKQCLWYKEDEIKAADPAELARKAARALEIKMELEKLLSKVTNTNTQAEFKEYIWSASATAWLLSVQLAKKKYEYAQTTIDESIPIPTPNQIIKDGQTILVQLKTLWRARNRESELRDVVETFKSVLDRAASQLFDLQ